MSRFSLLLPFLCLLPVSTAHAAGSDHWTRVKSPHFNVLTNAGEGQGRHIAGQLERIRTIFHEIFPSAAADAGQTITVLGLKNDSDFQALEPTAYQAKGQLKLAGYFMRNDDGYHILLRLNAEGEHPFATVYHEYTHFMLARDSEWMPLWLNEGLAEFFQNTELTSKDALLGEPSVWDILYLRQNKMLPLATLFAVDASSPYYHEDQKGSMFYAESWALTHMLMIRDREKGTHQVEDYAVNLQKHEDPVTAAQHAFGDLIQLQKQLSMYIQASAYEEFKMKITLAEDESSYPATSISQAEADAARAEILIDNRRGDDAKTLLAAGLQEPANATAREAMGFLAWHDGQKSDATRWFGEAIKLDPTNPLTRFYYAESIMESGDTAHFAEVEENLQESIKLNPQFSRSYDSLAQLYSMQHQKLDEAHMLNLKAIALEPDNVYYRVNTATILQEQGNIPSAILVLQFAQAHAAKNPQDIAMLQTRIAQLQHYQEITETAQRATEARVTGTPGTAASAPEAISKGSVSTQNTVTLKSGKTLPIEIPESDSQFPAEEPTGALHVAQGMLSKVRCSYPTIMTVEMNTKDGRILRFYRSDFYKIDYTSTAAQTAEFKPCAQLQGMTVKLQYADTAAKNMDGQIVSVDLSK